MKLFKSTLIVSALLVATMSYADDSNETQNTVAQTTAVIPQTTETTSFEQIGQTRHHIHHDKYGGGGGGGGIRPTSTTSDAIRNQQTSNKQGANSELQNFSDNINKILGNKNENKNNNENSNEKTDNNRNTEREQEKEREIVRWRWWWR